MDFHVSFFSQYNEESKLRAPQKPSQAYSIHLQQEKQKKEKQEMPPTDIYEFAFKKCAGGEIIHFQIFSQAIDHFFPFSLFSHLNVCISNYNISNIFAFNKCFLPHGRLICRMKYVSSSKLPYKQKFFILNKNLFWTHAL